MDKFLDFRHAYYEMLKGKKIKRSHWGGYWAFENGTIMIHTFDGKTLDIRNTDNVPYTFESIVAKDWSVVEEGE